MIEDLIWILERSVKRNGEIGLTNKHLLNIVKMLRRKQLEDDFHEEMIGGKAELEACGGL